jgi:hypothetical protein
MVAMARDRFGAEKLWSQRCDVLLPAGAGKVIADPAAELYLEPVTSNLEHRSVEFLGFAVEIEIAIDAVMFEGGEMFAADNTYAKDIAARVDAARDTAVRVRRGLAGGLSRGQIQQAVAAGGRSMRGGQGTLFRDLSRWLFLQQCDRFNAYLDAMERLSLPSISIRTV